MNVCLRTPVQMVRDGADRFGEDVILTFVDVGRDGRFVDEQRSYAKLLTNGSAIGGSLVAEGMRRGDSFAIIMRNHPEFVDAMIGAEMAGTVFVPIDPRTRGDKLTYILRFAECRGAIVADYALPHLLAVVDDVPGLEWVWVLGAVGESAAQSVRLSWLDEVTSRGLAPPTGYAPDLTWPMQLLFTSGTTGNPKAMVAPYGRFAVAATLAGAFGMRTDDRPYTGLSLTHANAQLITLSACLANGLPLVISRQFTKSRLWEILSRYECNMFNLLGGMAIAIYAEPESIWEQHHMVRYVLSAGMPANLWRPFADRFGVEIFEFYGTAEGGLTFNSPGAGPVGSIGKPPPDSICAVLKDDDSECPPNALGEICFRPATGEAAAPVVYLKDPAASNAKVHNGWFRSGDIGYKDADGWLYFSHRMGSSVRRNGEFIDTPPIEAEIAAIEAVADVHVYGLATLANAPGEKEVIAAVVTRKQQPFDPRRIFEVCRERIGAASMPSFVQLVDEIPKTASEKPQERFLVKMLTDGRSILFDPSGAKVTLPQTGEET